jgi:hypothetical protein
MSSDGVNANDKNEVMMHLLLITHEDFVMNSSCYQSWHLQFISCSLLMVTPFQHFKKLLMMACEGIQKEVMNLMMEINKNEDNTILD